MRNVIRIIVALILFAQSAWAGRIVLTDQQKILAVKQGGVGQVWPIKVNENRFLIRVDSYQDLPNGKGLVVNYTRADDVLHISFSDEPEKFGFDIERQSERNQRERSNSVRPPDNADAGHGDFTVGIGAAMMDGAQYVFITNSKENRKIQQAYAAIEKLKQAMGDDWDQVNRGYIDLAASTVTLDLQIRTHELARQPILKNPGTFRNMDLRVLNDPAYVDIKNLSWQSEDPDFIRQAEGVRSVLVSAEIRDSLQRKHYEISKHALIQADNASALMSKDEAEFYLNIAKVSADILVGLDPFTGFARSLFESITGRNIITGEDLSTGERILAGLGLLTAGYATEAYKIFSWLRPIAQQVGPKTIQIFEAAQKFIAKTGTGFQIVGEGSEVRKVNLKSKLRPDWGLTNVHIEKHFFGSSDFSLRVIDPKGNPDQWMQNIAELMQSPVTRTINDGIVDIYKMFPKAGAEETYKMGIRLFPKSDGTFDLVTVLTDQTRKIKWPKEL